MSDSDTPVQKVTDKALDAGKEVAGGIGSNLWGFVTSAVGAPFRMVGDVFKGMYENTVGNLYAMLLSTAGIAAASQFVPDLLMAIPLKFKGKKLGEIMGEHMRDNGMVGILKDSALIALASGATLGAGKAVLGSTVDSSGTADTPIGSKIGGTLGSLAAAAGVGALAFSFIKSNDIGFVGGTDHSPKAPDQTPGSTTPPTAQRA